MGFAGERKLETTASRIAHSMPKALLISFADLTELVSNKTNGLITVPEVADAVTSAYDGDSMPIYEGGSYGLAEEMGQRLNEVELYNYRVDIVCEIFNSRYWKNTDAMIRSTPVHDIMIRKSDAQIIANHLGSMFFPDSRFSFDLGNVSDENPGTVGMAEQHDSMQKCRIAGPTFARLVRAIAAFPNRYPGFAMKAPKLDDDIRPWLTEAGLAENEAERRVFGTIIREHFELLPDTQKTK
jgi:hypothetical protein